MEETKRMTAKSSGTRTVGKKTREAGWGSWNEMRIVADRERWENSMKVLICARGTTRKGEG